MRYSVFEENCYILRLGADRPMPVGMGVRGQRFASQRLMNDPYSMPPATPAMASMMTRQRMIGPSGQMGPTPYGMRPVSYTS